MREILFRGKRTDNGEWVYGNPVEWLNETKDVSIIAHPFGCCIDEVGNLVLIEEPFVCKVHTETVGQSTGLKDKNGKEIFEGDIVRCLNSYGEDYYTSSVQYDEGAFVVDVMGMDYDRTVIGWALDWLIIYNNDIEVTGNIHDNPELLEAE